MPVFIKDERYVLFPHVPEDGWHLGRAALPAQRLGGAPAQRARSAAGTLHYVRRCSPQHLHAALLREMIDLSRVELCFMVVRDPIARFRSEYAMRQKDPSKTDAASVDAWADRVLARATSATPTPSTTTSGRSTSSCCPDTEVFRLEDGLTAMVDDLNERFGLGAAPPRLDHRLKSTERHGIASRDVEISPALEETAARAVRRGLPAVRLLTVRSGPVSADGSGG